MKVLIPFLTFIFVFQNSKGQDTIRRLEFGSTITTVNRFNQENYYAPDRPAVEFINGLFFRYTKKRLGLRVHASYTDNYSSYEPRPLLADAPGGDSRNKDLRIGAGGQFSILKRKEWLYTFLDLSYRNVFTTGHDYGGFRGANDSYSSTANGFDCFLGLGFKIKTIKNIFITPEIGYYSSSKFVNKTTNSYGGQISKYKYSETNINPVLKLHLTVKF